MDIPFLIKSLDIKPAATFPPLPEEDDRDSQSSLPSTAGWAKSRKPNERLSKLLMTSISLGDKLLIYNDGGAVVPIHSLVIELVVVMSDG
jgi:hypothetical protein